MNPLLAEEIQEVEEIQQYQQFQITDLDSLNWALRKVHAYNAQLKEIQTVANAERQRIDSWEQRESKGINESIEFFHNLIADYHAKVLAEDPKKKTLSTPYGKSKSTTSKAQPDKADEEQLIKFVEDNQLPFVEKVPKLKWAELKKTLQIVEVDGVQKVVDENGQVVPGVTVKPQTTTFKVEI
ncbi:phage protein [Lysinibacillus sp. PLM2]|nr:phage protein [Lysinibacillus sp. PLM2]